VNGRPLLPEQHNAARVVGAIYLLAMATSMFAELYVRMPLFVRGNAVQTMMNIASTERLFRAAAVIHLITFASDAVIAVALYIILAPVNRNIALLGAFWRLADCAILSIATLNDFAALRFLSGVDYLNAFDRNQLLALGRVFLSIRAAGFQFGFVFLGLGSTVFAVLWLKSRYVPRALAMLGIFASLLLALAELLFLVFPAWDAASRQVHFLPMFLFEVTMGFWLLAKGIREPAET
jgi:hypothetical protein